VLPSAHQHLPALRLISSQRQQISSSMLAGAATPLVRSKSNASGSPVCALLLLLLLFVDCPDPPLPNPQELPVLPSAQQHLPALRLLPSQRQQISSSMLAGAATPLVRSKSNASGSPVCALLLLLLLLLLLFVDCPDPPPPQPSGVACASIGPATPSGTTTPPQPTATDQ
jgi:hypothetical protein